MKYETQKFETKDPRFESDRQHHYWLETENLSFKTDQVNFFSLKLKIQGSNLTDNIIFWLGTENLSFKTDQVNNLELFFV